MRWACILLPQLALDAAARLRADPQAPFALIAGPAQRRVLHAVNPAARELGLRPGMALTTAQALSHGVDYAPFDADAGARQRERLAAWAYGFSSQVSLDYPHALVLEIGASRALFGPWPQLQARLRSELHALGFRHRLVAAPHPTAARVLCNVHDGLALDHGPLARAIGQLPITRAGLPADAADALTRMGLRRLAQVLALPRDGLARRFGPQLLQHLDELAGKREAQLQWYRPPDRYEQYIELGFEVESHPPLLFPLRRLTGDLAAYLSGRDGGVQKFELRMEHDDHPDSLVPVGLLSAERDPAMLFELARGRLEQAQVPAPVRGLRLIAEALPPFVPMHRDLFDERAQQALPWEQLRERLRARLGDDAVHGIAAHADHRPEQAWRPISVRKPPPLPEALPPRPGWLLEKPIPLRDVAPQLLAGPERLETGWWDGDTRRDYYRVRTRLGQHAWVFRPAGGDEDDGFMLHGWFA